MMAGVRLNLGCGPVINIGEIGVDYYRTEGCHVQADLLALPFRNECAEFVRLDHVLEHLPVRQAVSALSEALRTLLPGGALQIGVPDLAALCQAYLESDMLGRVLIGRWIFGSHAHEGEQHKSGWDERSLTDLLRALGAEEISIGEDVARTEGRNLVATARRSAT